MTDEQQFLIVGVVCVEGGLKHVVDSVVDAVLASGIRWGTESDLAFLDITTNDVANVIDVDCLWRDASLHR